VSKFVYSGRTKKSADVENGAEFLPFDEVVKVSDFLVITTAYTPDMRHKFNKAIFQAMKKTAVLINVSRGGIINQEDLYEALSKGEIYAAGLDVMEPEPLPKDHPLTTLNNCVLFPHLGSAEIDTRAVMGQMAAENIIQAIEGDPMPAQLP